MSVTPTTAAGLADEALDLMVGQARPDRAMVATLVASAGGRREPLEAASLLLASRLGRQPDDFPASKALGLVSAAIGAIGWGLAGLTTPHPAQRP